MANKEILRQEVNNLCIYFMNKLFYKDSSKIDPNNKLEVIVRNIDLQSTYYIDPKNINAYFQIAIALSNNNRILEAIEIYKRIFEVDPNNIYAYIFIGIELNKLERYSETIENCRKAIAINIKNIDAYNLYAFTLQKQGKFIEAIQIFKKALEIDYTHTNLFAQNNIIEILVIMNKF